MSNFYFLPPEYVADEHGALGNCISSILYLIRSPGQDPIDAFTAENLFDRIFNGLGQRGESFYSWHCTRWKYRDSGSGDAGLLPGEFPEDAFLVWLDETSTFHPQWRVYEEQEFKKVFVACCRNFVGENPLRRARHS